MNKAIDFHEFSLSSKIFEKLSLYIRTKKEENNILKKRIYMKYLKLRGFKSWLLILD